MQVLGQHEVAAAASCCPNTCIRHDRRALLDA